MILERLTKSVQESKLNSTPMSVTRQMMRDMLRTVFAGFSEETRIEVAKQVKEASKRVYDEITNLFNSVGMREQLTPKKGVDYFDGKEGPRGPKGDSVVGPQGEKGDKGDAGSPDTPEQVVDKVNSSSKLINKNKIDGLEDWMQKIQKAFSTTKKSGASGGGMGTPQHQQFALTSGTTSVTLTSTVAFAGLGIIGAYVQGQFIARGTHYTVSGKVMTLLFTPDDGTALDVIYIRT